MQSTSDIRMVHASTGVATQAERLGASNTPSTRSNRVPPGQYVPRRIHVAVVTLATLWAVPMPKLQAEASQSVTASVATLAGRGKAVNDTQLPPITLALVSEHRPELPKGHITDGLGQTPVLDHAPDVEILNGDDIESTDQVRRRLIQGVLTGPSNSLLNPSNADTLAMPTAASLLPSGQDALCPGKTTLVFGRNPRVDDLLPITGRGQSLHPQIHPHGQSRGRQGGDNLFQNQRNVIPAAGLPNDRDRTRVGAKAPTPVNLEPSQPRNHKVRVVRIGLSEPEAEPSVSGRLAMPPLLELGIPSLLAEKVPISSVKMLERLLERNTRNLGKPLRLGVSLPLGQLGRTADEGDLLLGFGPCLPAPRQGPIVNVSARPEDPSQSNLLTLGRVEPKPMPDLHREKVSLNATQSASLSPRQAIEVCATKISTSNP
jgi:hypothetical protein